MRQKRAKTYRKLLASYIRAFGLRPPLQILIDAPMTQALAAMKIAPHEVASRLETVLQVSNALPSSSKAQARMVVASAGQPAAAASRKATLVKPMITQCAISQLYQAQKQAKEGQQKAGEDVGVRKANVDLENRAVELAKSWERRFCNHKDAIPGDRCMREMIGDTNKHRYVIAANSPALRAAIRQDVAGVPMVYVNDHRVLVIEPMSELTKRRCEELEKAKLKGDSNPRESVLGKRAAEALQDTGVEQASAAGLNHTSDPTIPPHKKRPKAPNPLSVRKPKAGAKSDEGAVNKGAEAMTISKKRREKKKRAKARLEAGAISTS